GPLVMRMLCHAIIQRLPDESLSVVADSLVGLYDFVGYTLSQTDQARARSELVAIGISDLLQKKIDILAQGSYKEEGLSRLKFIRDRLAGGLEYADYTISQFSAQLELADLFVPDSDPVLRPTNVTTRLAPDDGSLLCDPDESPGD